MSKKTISQRLTSTLPIVGAALLMAACSSMGWGEKSSGSTHTMTGGAEAAPTSEATPQPAGPRGSRGTSSGTSSGMPSDNPGDTSGTSSGATQGGGNATTGGAEAMPTRP